MGEIIEQYAPRIFQVSVVAGVVAFFALFIGLYSSDIELSIGTILGLLVVAGGILAGTGATPLFLYALYKLQDPNNRKEIKLGYLAALLMGVVAVLIYTPMPFPSEKARVLVGSILVVFEFLGFLGFGWLVMHVLQREFKLTPLAADQVFPQEDKVDLTTSNKTSDHIGGGGDRG